MQLLSRDSHLGTEAEFATVGESRGCVGHHNRGVHLGQKPLGVSVVIRDDRLGVTGRVFTDVRERVVEVLDDADRDIQSAVLGRPVLVGRGDDIRNQSGSSRVAVQRHPLLPKCRGHGRQDALGGRPHDQHGLDGVAHARALHLRVDDDVAGPLERRRLVEHDVHHTSTGLDDGNG